MFSFGKLSYIPVEFMRRIIKAPPNVIKSLIEELHSIWLNALVSLVGVAKLIAGNLLAQEDYLATEDQWK